MDCGANQSIFGNRDLLEDIETVEHLVLFKGMKASVLATQRGRFRDFGYVFYCPDVQVNLLSTSRLRKEILRSRGRGDTISFDFDAGVISVRRGGRTYDFPENSDGLYTLEFETHRAYVGTTVDAVEAPVQQEGHKDGQNRQRASAQHGRSRDSRNNAAELDKVPWR